ncbi:MAG: hypothetical protein OXC69_04900 [Candidatus Tectomicrobia bacterium]|nr:hypothetical protein [Candidatus Tectomicrobia bacterium]
MRHLRAQCYGLFFAGNRISAENAQRIVFVNCVVSRNEPGYEIAALAQGISMRDPFVLRMARLSLI